MKRMPQLKPGDTVEIIAPASRCTDQQLADLKALLESWQLTCLIADDIFGDDLFCANTDTIRFQHLQNALLRPATKAIICARGGYGSMRLIPKLSTIIPPESPKIIVGMSDITALQLYLQQHWQWPTIHGAAAPSKFSPESIASLKSILFGEVKQVVFSDLTPLNKQAKEIRTIDTTTIGGNLSLIQTSIGTSWQINGRDKLILLEEVNERGYRVDRMLEHLQQAGVFKDAVAILFGDFLDGKEPDGTCLIKPTLARFAESCNIPVVQVAGVGHGYANFPLPLGTEATLQLGHSIKLTCFR